MLFLSDPAAFSTCLSYNHCTKNEWHTFNQLEYDYVYLMKVCAVEHSLGDPGLGVGSGVQTVSDLVCVCVCVCACVCACVCVCV